MNNISAIFRDNVLQLGDNCIQNFHLGGISSDIRSEIKLYNDARAGP